MTTKETTVKVIIAGTKTFDNYKLLEEKCDYYLENLLTFDRQIEVVSGMALGADTLGEQYAKKRGFKLTQIKPEWDKHGKAAGPIRNAEMGDYADCAVIFWDGKSKGTKHMIEVCKNKALKYRVINYTTL